MKYILLLKIKLQYGIYLFYILLTNAIEGENMTARSKTIVEVVNSPQMSMET